MAITNRAIAKRDYEDRLVDAVMCLDCDALRGQRCRNRQGRDRVTCCQAREDFGRPILLADLSARSIIRAMVR